VRPVQAAPVKKAPQFEEQVEVGLEEDDVFCVCKRLIGPGGGNMKGIVAAAGGKAAKVQVQLRGCGAKKDDCLNEGQKDPLVVIVRADDFESFKMALDMAQHLVVKVRAEHEAWCKGGEWLCA